MPTLEPFSGHVVAAAHAGDVVAPPFDSLTENERRARGRNPDSFLGVLPPRPDADDTTGLERCRAHLDRLLAAGHFEPVETPVLGVLRIGDGRRAVTGVLGDVAASSFVDGTIAVHEQVRAPTVAALRRHLEIVRAVSSPVCVAHTPAPRVAELTAQVTREPPRVTLSDAAGTLRLWLVADAGQRDALTEAVGATRDWLVADGHHRAEAARPWGRVLCVLMAEDELEILPFHRRVRAADPGTAGDRLRDHGLEVAELEAPAAPRGPGEVTVAGGGRWWQVELGGPAGTPSPLAALTIVRAERDVVAPLLGDPATPVPSPGTPGPAGVAAVPPTADLTGLAVEGAVTVVLHPPTWDEVRRVVRDGGMMPAKSTYVLPKQRSGAVVVPRGHRLP